MPVGMSRTDGVIILTLTSDPHSLWPPLCQICSGLCYGTVCCSVTQNLKDINGSLTVLGVIQVMFGVLNIGLGAILMGSDVGSWWQMDVTGFPHWMGAFFVVFGVVSILCERYRSACLLVFNVFLHLAGAAFAITAVVLYSINIIMAAIPVWRGCYRINDYYDRSRTMTPTGPSHKEQFLMAKCVEGRDLILILVRGINAVLIIVSVLELCVAISSVRLGIKSLRSKEKGPNKSPEDPESFKPLLEEVSATPTT